MWQVAGRSSAWLERLLWEQEVARSNRVAPTYKSLRLVATNRGELFFVIAWQREVRVASLSCRLVSYGRWNEST